MPALPPPPPGAPPPPVSPGSRDINVDAWVQRVAAQQRERVGTQEFEQIRARAQSMQRAQSLAGRAKRMSRASSLSESWFASSSAKMSPAARLTHRTEPTRAGADLSMVAEASDEEEEALVYRSSLAQSMQQNAGLQRAMTLLSPQSIDAVADVDEEMALGDAADEALDALEAELQSAPVPGGAAAGIDAILPDLAREPDNDNERAAKFALYEKFLETVEKNRTDALSLWQASRPELPAAVGAALERDVKRLDAPSALGLDDSMFGGATWFVQPMCRRAAGNNQAVTRLLASINTKLELIARQTDCPICLEPIEEGDAKTLACCHKTCKTCWEQWTAVRGGAPFCPLCRHDDFVSEVISTADRRRAATETIPSVAEWALRGADRARRA